MESVSKKKRFIQSIICGSIIGFICGFIGAGGGNLQKLQQNLRIKQNQKH